MSTNDEAGPRGRAAPAEATGRSLGRGLKTRHITMMGLGSAIGTGLFIGTGQAIAAAGPGALLSYAFAGIIVIFAMRMLGEMGSAIPSSGSFSEYARIAIGHWAGFSMGWMYWAMLIMVLGAEVTGASAIVDGWLPAVPQWVVTLAFVLLFSALNLGRVSNFGEFEFWFAAIKVTVIIVFLVIGVLLVFGLLPGTGPVGTDNLLGEGGFLPRGWSGVAGGLLLVAFAFGGIELVAIAAAESADPEHSVIVAVRNVLWRIIVFYLGSVAVMVVALPWTDQGLQDNPFVAVLGAADIPLAAGFMELIIVVALLSAFNAQLYGTARMAYSLARNRDAPRILGTVTRNGSPTPAVLLSIFFAFVTVLLNWLLPEKLLSILMNAVGSVLLIVWAMICISQLKLRPRLEDAGILRLKMWLHPYLTWLTLAGLATLVALMLTDAEARVQLLSTAVFFLLVVAAYRLNARWRDRAGIAREPAAVPLPPPAGHGPTAGAAVHTADAARAAEGGTADDAAPRDGPEVEDDLNPR